MFPIYRSTLFDWSLTTPPLDQHNRLLLMGHFRFSTRMRQNIACCIDQSYHVRKTRVRSLSHPVEVIHCPFNATGNSVGESSRNILLLLVHNEVAQMAQFIYPTHMHIDRKLKRQTFSILDNSRARW